LNRFQSGTFSGDPPRTFSATFGCHHIDIQGVQVRLGLWDIPRCVSNIGRARGIFRHLDGAIFAFDLTDGDTLSGLAECMAEFKEDCHPNPCMIVAGTRADLPFDKHIIDEAEVFATANGLELLITSALTGSGVTELFERFGEMLLMRRFRECRFEILWRGSRDGFGARDFHSHCDGQTNTITLIRDLNGNIFGGFTPIAWESPSIGKMKKDATNKTIIFTVKNPCNCPATIFHLIYSSSAIRVDRKKGPCFGESEIWICDECDKKANNAGKVGTSFTNVTGYDGTMLLTGSSIFYVSEIEVFKVLIET
jgi:hypothetical protein